MCAMWTIICVFNRWIKETLRGKLRSLLYIQSAAFLDKIELDSGVGGGPSFPSKTPTPKEWAKAEVALILYIL